MKVPNPESLTGPADAVDLTSMIDVVFLLLIYFMVTSAIVKTEADISILLPTPGVEQTDPLDLPEEHYVQVMEDGQVMLNGQPFDGPFDPALPQFTRTLTRLRESSDQAKVKTMVTIQAEAYAQHGRVIDVLNACAAAQIKLVSFAYGE